ARLSAGAAALAELAPALAERVLRFRQTLDLRLRSTAPSEPRPVHRDFHAENVLVDGTTLALVDFERSAMGRPADDVGSMWARLPWLAPTAGEAGAPFVPGRAAFVEAYVSRANGSSRHEIPLHAALHCLLYACQSLKHPHRRARETQAENLLRTGEHVL